MTDLVRVARDEGVPTLISIHQVELARAFADRIVGIAAGRGRVRRPAGRLDEAALDRVYRFDRPRRARPHRSTGASWPASAREPGDAADGRARGCSTRGRGSVSVWR